MQSKLVGILVALAFSLAGRTAWADWPDTGNKHLDQLLCGAKQESSMTRAQELYRQAIKLDANCVYSYTGRAKLYKQAGMYEKALGDCDQAIRLKPNYALTYLTKANTLFLMGKYSLAIEAARKASVAESVAESAAEEERKKGEGHSSLYCDTNNEDLRIIGASLYHLRKYREAIAPLTSGISGSHGGREFADALYFRGLCYMELKKHDRALTDFDQAIKLEAKRPQYYAARARVLRGLGKIQLASADEVTAKALPVDEHELFLE